MLDVVIGKAYITFDNRLYLQLVGLFVGCKPSPVAHLVLSCVSIRSRGEVSTSTHISCLWFPGYMYDMWTMLVPSPNHARRRLLHFRVLLVRILMDGWVGRLIFRNQTQTGPRFLTLRSGFTGMGNCIPSFTARSRKNTSS